MRNYFVFCWRKGVCLRQHRTPPPDGLAALLNTSQTVYSRYERGFQTIPVEHLLTLADYYDVSTDYILGRTNNQRTAK